MPILPAASEVIDREFLGVRARLIDVAATLDRIDRAEGSAADPRLDRIRQSLQILGDLNSEYQTAKTKLSLACLTLETASFSDQDREYLAQAIQTFEKLGARADLAKARELEQQL